jgi:hypothetical protein
MSLKLAIGGMRPIHPTRVSPPPSKHMLPTPPHRLTEWILDSGATNHVTNDINNLSSFFHYDGQDTLQIGSGAGLPILHIGSSNLLISSHSISLKNVLHVSNFIKNLLIVSQLLQDNPHLTLEFSLFSCSFKDHPTKHTIL